MGSGAFELCCGEYSFNFHKIPYFGVRYLFYDVWWLVLKKRSEGEKTSEDDGICEK